MTFVEAGRTRYNVGGAKEAPPIFFVRAAETGFTRGTE
jgi:hypothetical protein